MAVGGMAGYAGAALGASVAAAATASGTSSIGAGMAGGMIGGMASGAINGAGMAAISGGSFDDIMEGMTLGTVMGGFGGAISVGIGCSIGDFSGVPGSSFKNGVYELGHSTLKGLATGLAGGAMIAAMKQDASYLWTGALFGAGINATIAGLKIAALGTMFVPDPVKYGKLADYGQIYRRGSVFMARSSGITLGNEVSVKLTGYVDYDKYLLQHEIGHIVQIDELGILKFYSRTATEYTKHIFNGGWRSVYTTPGTLEFYADRYAFEQLGYYYNSNGKSILFP